MKAGTVIIAVVALIAIAGVVYFVTRDGGLLQDMPAQNGTDMDGASDAGDGSSTVPLGYRTYTSADLNFSLLVPADATASRVGDSRVEFTYLGPGNEPNTEIADGFTATVFREPTDAPSVVGYADRVLAEVRERSDTTITRGREAQMVDGKRAYRFSYRGALGNEITTYIFLDESVGYQVSYSVTDPENRGYERMVSTMLESLQFGSQGSPSNVSSVKLALLDYDGIGPESDGPSRGCDRVVMVDEQIQPTAAPLTAALSRLFAIDSEEYKDWNHFIAKTNDTLSFERATVENGTASIYLSGQLSGLAGVCDNPRAKIQIEETALQFPTVDDVVIYLNEERTELQPGGQGA